VRPWRRYGSAAAAALVLFTVVAPANSQTNDDPETPPESVRARTGYVTVSPRIVKVGERVTASYVNLGGVTWHLSPPDGADCTGRPVALEGEELKHSVTGVKGGMSSCSWVASGRGWQSVSASITGPCGDPEAVRQGKAEFASCASARSNDHYYVSDSHYISGTVRQADGRPMAGVPIQLSGARSERKVTGASGSFAFRVPEGGYSVSAGRPGLCRTGTRLRNCQNPVSVTVPDSQSVDFEPATEGVIEGHVRDSQARGIDGVTVRIIGPSGQVLTTDGQGHYRANVPEGAYTITATKADRAFCTARSATGVGQPCVRQARVNVLPNQRVNFTPEDDPGIIVAIHGDEGVRSGFLPVRVSVSNPSDQTIEDVRFADSRGLSINSLLPNNSVAPTPTIILTDGPTPAPPTSLAPGATFNIDYRFVPVVVGRAELAVDVQGTRAGRTEPVRGTEHGIATISDRDVTQADIDRAKVEGIEDALNAAGEAKRTLDLRVGELMSTTTTIGTAEVTAGHVTAARDMGLPDSFAGFLKESGENQLDFWKTFGGRWINNVHSSGQAGGQMMADIAGVIEDPVAVRGLAEGFVEWAKTVPSSALANGGYLLDAFSALETPDGLANIYDDNAALLSRMVEGVRDAGVGALELRAQAAERARTDPRAYRREVAQAWADGTFAVTKEVVVGVAGEGVGLAGRAVGSRVVGGLRNLRNAVSPTREAVESTAELAGAGAMSEATRRIALGEAAARTAQELPYGTVLGPDDLVARAGILPGDAAEINSIINGANDRWPGLDLEIIARTSEPLSVGIDGVAKREFVKPKAISSIDQLMGGESSFAGRSSVFNPRQLDDEVLDALESRNPGMRARIQERFDAQKSLFEKEWPSPEDASKYPKSLRFLVDASSQYDEGITVLVSRPGHPLPDGLRYLEQLNEPEWLASHNVSASRASELKEQLTGFDASGRRTGAGHPDQAKVKLAAEEKNGTITFSDRGKPIVSDLDLQAVRPRNGVWPTPPPTRGEIEAYVAGRMRNVSRFPFHGWSDAAIDLPAEYLEAAAKFELNTAHPAAARKAAEGIARRFRDMARLTRQQADRLDTQIAGLERSGQTSIANEVRAKKEKLLEKARKFDGFTNPNDLIRQWPPGEKVISFTSGGARVSSGTGGR
jgi:Carboxypeptidase regulatory-like domain